MEQWRYYRNYEVSVWTLQDSFITTLKSGDPIMVTTDPALSWYLTRAQGQIQNGEMELNIDGTQNFSFDIPMYLFKEGKRIENPNWYLAKNLRYGNNIIDEFGEEHEFSRNVLTSMRKIKVIFNKWHDTNDDNPCAVFEFLITQVEETHESDNLICHVTCEGLAFHELGKVGYKRSLTIDEFNNEYYDWSIEKVGTGETYTTEAAKEAAKPKANLLYWMSKAKINKKPSNANNINPTEWYYDIRMVHTSLVHLTTVVDDKIYEEGYATDWDENGIPINYTEVREKCRLVNINESNLYNITQDLAEKFEVFCKYEYTYDNNYNIIGRTIVFYNNFLVEGQNVETLMYPNSASKISRMMDSTDISTKMFVRSVEASDLYTGMINIMDCDANLAKEDYLLNFNYLHEIGTISDEQYDAISTYELAMREINDKLVPLQDAYSNLSDLLVDAKAKVTTLTNSVELDQERITENTNLIAALDTADGEADGLITRDYRNPEAFTLMKDTSDKKYDTYYIQLNSNDKCKGIKPETFHLYKDYHTTTSKTYAYAIAFDSWQKSTIKERTDMSIPIPLHRLSNAWVDYAYTYKGTIGTIPSVTSLPAEADITETNKRWAYKVIDANYPSGYTVTIDKYLCYNKNNKKWEIKDSIPSGWVNKGTIGKAKDIDTLPTASEENKGWVYKVLTANTNSKDVNIGGIIVSNGSEWLVLKCPTANNNDIYNPVENNKNIKEADLKNLYEASGNSYVKTTDTTVNNNKTYYTRYKHNASDGFFIIKRERLSQMNGLIAEAATATRKGATRNGIDYVGYIRHLYYVCKSADNLPSKSPTIETAKTAATEIVGYNTLKKWSSFLSTPDNIYTDNISDIDSYKYGYVWEIKMSLGGKFYSNIISATGATMKDVTDTLIKTQMTSASSSYLKADEEIFGTMTTDDYGNLEKVTGLFSRLKTGSYFTYGAIEKANITLAKSNVTYDNILNLIKNNIKPIAVKKTYPTDKKLKFIVSKESMYCTRGQVIYAYHIKYYNKNEIPATISSDKASTIREIVPIFYLKNSKAPTAPTANNVTYGDVEDKWTTTFPTKTIKDTNKHYYRGWKVTYYDDSNKYVYNTSEAKELNPSTEGTTDDEDSIPNYVYATFKYEPAWYYKKIKDSWVTKLYDDQTSLTTYEERKGTLETLTENILDEITTLTEEKDTKISNFEHMMGAALRESYWQPEDEYQDYGTKYDETLMIHSTNVSSSYKSTFFHKKPQYADIGWDSVLFDEEDKLYYESSINKIKMYYPCIDLSKLTKNSKGETSNFLTKYLTWANLAEDDEDREHPYAFIFNPTTVIIPEGDSDTDIRYSQYYTIGSRAKLAFIRSGFDIKPVLLLLDASSLSDEELLTMYNTGKIGQLNATLDYKKATNVTADDLPKLYEKVNKKYVLTEDTAINSNKQYYYCTGHLILKLDRANTYDIYSDTANRNNNAWLNVTREYNSETQKYEWVEAESYANNDIVYSRVVIPSLKLKTNTKDLVLEFNGNEMKQYEHYYVLTKSYYNATPNAISTAIINNDTYTLAYYDDLETIENDDLINTAKFVNCYTITLKSDYLFSQMNFTNWSLNPLNNKLRIYYAISNADVDIYLDAKKILKENAYPKVSYEIEVSKWSPTLLTNLHNKLAQLVMINDTELKFLNTFGYISSVTLDLDHEEKDTIEVKNYKTKFEDLFSKIVAETEEMHKNSYNIGLAGAMASGDSVSATLDPEGFADTIGDYDNQQILQQFLEDYFDGPGVVLKMVLSIFNEAGLIMAAAAYSLDNVLSTTTENANILAGFKENVVAALSPTISTSKTPPSTFKPGDIWINNEDEENPVRSVAMGYNTTGGSFVETYNGKLSAISGPSLEINATTGEIDILNPTNINIMSGKDVYIGADANVNITGNKAVNIGGTTINMASCNIIGEGYSGVEGGGGIHLVSTEYIYKEGNIEEGSISRVDIHGDGIELASKNGIVIKSGAGIDIKSSDDVNVSAILLDREKGIYLGSTSKISLFSGDITDLDNPVGASVELSKDHLLLGMANVGQAGATSLEMTTNLILLAAGENLDKLPKDAETGELIIDDIISPLTGTDNNTYYISGIQILPNYIGMVTGGISDRSLVSIKPDEIILGQATLKASTTGDKPEDFTGSFVWLTNKEVYIGTLGDLTVNTNNIKIQSKNLSEGKGTTKENVDGMGFALGMDLQGSAPNVGLGFWIKKITDGDTTTYEKHLVVDGDITALTFIANSGTNQFKATPTELGFYKSNGDALMTISANAITIGLGIDFNFNVEQSFSLTSDNLIINPSATGENSVFALRKVNSDSETGYDTFLNYLANGILNLTVNELNVTAEDGLTILGSKISTIITSAVSDAASEFKMTDSEIWAAVTGTHTSNLSSLKILENQILLTSTNNDVTSKVNILAGKIELDASETNYVHINSKGIKVLGNRITINGKEVWARDDIIIMDPNTLTYGSVEASMADWEDDWVLIKPQFNAEKSFELTTPNKGINHETLTLSGDSNLSLGDNAGWYNYHFEITIEQTGTGDGLQTPSLYFTLSAYDGHTTRKLTTPLQVENPAADSPDNYYNDTDSYLYFVSKTKANNNGTTTKYDFNVKCVGNSHNLAAEGYVMSIKAFVRAASNTSERYTMMACRVTVTSDSVTSRVPCTVYYYPKKTS